jgi:hypothetical protein
MQGKEIIESQGFRQGVLPKIRNREFNESDKGVLGEKWGGS